jgi:hypothetical protein
LGRLKSAIYAWMEKVSFRSGAAAVGGVLLAAGVAITLVVVPGGPGGAVASAPAARAAAPTAMSPTPVPAASSSSSSSSSSPRAAPRPSRTTVPAAVAGDYRPSRAWASAAWYAARTPGRFAGPRPFGRRWLPGWRGWHRPAPWTWGLSLRHRRR